MTNNYTKPKRRHVEGSRARYLAAYADDLREKLIADMGGKCELHGKDCSGDLEFHHPDGRDYEPSDFSRWTRLAKYRTDWTQGRLVLRCRYHNRRDSNTQRSDFLTPPRIDEVPF
jgi:hypothetical protein